MKSLKEAIAGIAAVSLLTLTACSGDDQAEAATAEEITPGPIAETEAAEAEDAADAPAEEFAFGDQPPGENRIAASQELAEALDALGYSVTEERLAELGEDAGFNRPATTAEFFADPTAGTFTDRKVELLLRGEHLNLEADRDEEEAKQLIDGLVQAMAEGSSMSGEAPERVIITVDLPGQPEAGKTQTPYTTIRGSFSASAEEPFTPAEDITWW